MSENKEEVEEVEEGQENVQYKVSDTSLKAVDKILDMDKDDESLNKWKEQLLGNSLNDEIAPKDDPRRVVITSLTVMFKDRPGGDIHYDLSTSSQLEALKKTPFILKEGCEYKTKLQFRVQHELVTGLKHVRSVYRKGIRASKETHMIGSYGPQKEPHTVEIPRKEWDEAPKGMLARGSYKATSKFVDDDNQTHLEFDYAFAIKKDWGSDDKDDEE